MPKIKKMTKKGAIIGIPNRWSNEATPSIGFFALTAFCELAERHGERGALRRPSLTFVFFIKFY
jgi:hypothetical protein